MAQFARPDADQAAGSWTTAPLWSKVEEGVAGDDGTLINLAASLANDNADLRLSDVTNPDTGTYTLRADWHVVSGARTMNCFLELWDGVPGTGTLRATLSTTDPTADTDYSYNLSGAEITAVLGGDLTDLYFRIYYTYTGGGQPSAMAVDAVEFETPNEVTSNDGEIAESGSVNAKLPSEIAESGSVNAKLPSEISESASINAKLPSEIAEAASINAKLPSEISESGSVNVKLVGQISESASINVSLGSSDGEISEAASINVKFGGEISEAASIALFKIVTETIGAAGDYTDATAWEDATDIDLSFATGTAERRVGTILNEAISEGVLVTILGATADEWCYRELTTAFDHGGVRATGGRISFTTTAPGVRLTEDYAIATRFSVTCTVGTVGNSAIVGHTGLGTSRDNRVDRILVYDVAKSSTGTGMLGIRLLPDSSNGGIGTHVISNNTVLNLDGSAGGASGVTFGIQPRCAGATGTVTVECYGNTVGNITGTSGAVATGINTEAGGNANNVVTVKNNAAYGTSGGSGPVDFQYSAFSGASVVTDRNASEDTTADDNADGTHEISITPADEFVGVSAGSEDVHLKALSGSVLALGGATITPDGYVEFDFEGESRGIGGATDIGADEATALHSETAEAASINVKFLGEISEQGSINVKLPGQISAAGSINVSLGATDGEIAESGSVNVKVPSEIAESGSVNAKLPSEIVETGSVNVKLPSEIVESGSVNVKLVGQIVESGSVNVKLVGQVAESASISVKFGAEIAESGSVNVKFGAEISEAGSVNVKQTGAVSGAASINVSLGSSTGEISEEGSVNVKVHGQVVESASVSVKFGAEISEAGSVNVAAHGRIVETGSVNVKTPDEISEPGSVNVKLVGQVVETGSVNVKFGAEISESASVNVKFGAEIAESGSVNVKQTGAVSEAASINVSLGSSFGEIAESGSVNVKVHGQVVESASVSVKFGAEISEAASISVKFGAEVAESGSVNVKLTGQIAETGSINVALPEQAGEVAETGSINVKLPSEIVETGSVNVKLPSEIVETGSVNVKVHGLVVESGSVNVKLAGQVAKTGTVNVKHSAVSSAPGSVNVAVHGRVLGDASVNVRLSTISETTIFTLTIAGGEEIEVTEQSPTAVLVNILPVTTALDIDVHPLLVVNIVPTTATKDTQIVTEDVITVTQI